jgi:hypothetical protein
MSTNATFFRCSAPGMFLQSRIELLPRRRFPAGGRRCRSSSCKGALSCRRCRCSFLPEAFCSRMCGSSTRKAQYALQSILRGLCTTRHSQQHIMPSTDHLSMIYSQFSIHSSLPLFPRRRSPAGGAGALSCRRPKVEDAGVFPVEDAGVFPAGGAGVLPA